jgi:hypothetical protein
MIKLNDIYIINNIINIIKINDLLPGINFPKYILYSITIIWKGIYGFNAISIR